MQNKTTVLDSFSGSLDRLCVPGATLDDSARVAMLALVAKGRSVLESAGFNVLRVLDLDPDTRSCLMLAHGAIELIPGAHAEPVAHLVLVRDDDVAPASAFADPNVEHDAERIGAIEDICFDAAEQADDGTRLIVSTLGWLRVFAGALPEDGQALSTSYYAAYSSKCRDTVPEDLSLAGRALDVAGGTMIDRGFDFLYKGMFGLGGEGGGLRDFLVFKRESPRQVAVIFGAGAVGAFPDVSISDVDKKMLGVFCDAVGRTCAKDYGFASELMTVSLCRIQFPPAGSDTGALGQEETITFRDID